MAIQFKELEAIFLYNFTSFISWPEDKLPQGATVNICLVGENKRILDALSIIIDTEIYTENGHPLALIEIKQREEMSVCHIAFFSAEFNLEMLCPTLVKNSAILTVSDEDSFLEHGGMLLMGLYKNGRIKLILNHRQLQYVGLSVAPELLELVDIEEPERFICENNPKRQEIKIPVDTTGENIKPNNRQDLPKTKNTNEKEAFFSLMLMFIWVFTALVMVFIIVLALLNK